MSSNVVIELYLGSSVGKASRYLTNAFAFQSVAYGLSYELPKLAFIFPCIKIGRKFLKTSAGFLAFAQRYAFRKYEKLRPVAL